MDAEADADRYFDVLTDAGEHGLNGVGVEVTGASDAFEGDVVDVA